MRWAPLVAALLACCQATQVLTPSQITISHRKPIVATSTCGEVNGQPIREIYCSLAGSNQYSPYNQYSYHDDISTAQSSFQEMRNPREAFFMGGHGCGHCEAGHSHDAHPAANMVDGNTSWWQSPPLSRGMQYNQVNITIDLEQEFHVAYVWIQMANSPKPSNWVLERSADYGKTWQPWVYFAENPAECMRRFGMESLAPITEDTSVICRSDLASIQPLENAEMVINLLEHRPSRHAFATSEALQNFTRATNVRLKLLGTRTLQGHLMDLNEQTDPTVTRRYFYAIKEILMGGRCVCNGHASTCDILDPRRQRALLCRCEHNTCGDMCETCCPGFEQKKWQPTTAYNNFTCEPCNCFGRSNECQYEEELNEKKLSLDIHGKYEGGGRCLNCRHHTTGINCNECVYGYYRPAGVPWSDPTPCQACRCDPNKHTGACAEETGKCECQARFEGEDCDKCAKGYYDAPECKKCECAVEGTVDEICRPEGDKCPCKPGYGGTFCETCANGFTNFTAGCVECVCNEIGSEHSNCSAETGQCVCRSGFSGLSCDKCELGYFGFPNCTYCNCDPIGTEGGMCDSTSGQCLCKEGYVGERCDQCDIGYYGYPNCKACACDGAGAKNPECDTVTGQCPCYGNFTDRTCDKCAVGFYDYPICKACSCLIEGAKGQTCDNNGNCYCKDNFEGERCDRCKPNFYNFPACEECNCNPSGVLADFAGCDKVAPGELCSCRAHVTGRICDQCKPTFWDLQYHHEHGCVSCDCHLAGTVSRTNFCAQKDGQCECKRNAGGRRCDKCAEGYFNLQSHNQQGCEPCNCDIGGALRSECDMTSGQCRCRPRVTGLRCDRPIDNHYFPTLWHNQYEAEEGTTPDGRPVRFAVDSSQFPDFSWRGYVVFSPIQEKELLNIDIAKSSVYRLLFKFHNPTSVPITAQVTVTPRSPSTHDQEQGEKVTFIPTEAPSIKEITVNGKPFVMNPGRWTLSIATKQRLFLDYVVVLPAEYYEGGALRERESSPCLARNLPNSTCIDLLYPPLPQAARADLQKQSDTFKYVNIDGTTSSVELMPVELLPEIVGKAAFIRTDNSSRIVETVLNVPEDGEYAVLVEYHHLDKKDFPVVVDVSQEGTSKLNGSLVIHYCPYATFCRELITEGGIVPFVKLNKGDATVQMEVPARHEFGIAAINLIKKNEWSNDYLNQVPVCIRKNGKCLPQEYPPAANSIVAEAEHGPNKEFALSADKLPVELHDAKDLNVVALDDVKSTLEIQGVVPTRGHYMFIVHYLNPDNTPVEIPVLITYQDHFYEANVRLGYCPSVSGCRALIRSKERPEIIQYFIDDKYTTTFYYNSTKKGPIYIDSVTAVPFHSYTEALMTPQPVDLSSDFIERCGENFFANPPHNVSDFCREKIFSLTSDFNAAAFSCDCNARGSESFACDTYGGQCRCKANIIGRQCDRCAPGYFNFPECIKCKCNSNQQCDERTGQCFCPQHVEGTTCDKCVSNAFGYDPLIGCQLCGCHTQGSEGGIQQCDAESGQCLCRESVGGRRCDRCLAGFYGFPHCYECRCNRDGTTEDICNSSNAQCQCKENVVGPTCETCKAGTFDLSADNPLGCADCFCFGTTDQCRSSMFPVHIGAVDMSAFTVNDPNGEVSWDESTLTYEAADNSPNVAYFNVPIEHGSDHTTSYGLMMTFKLSNTARTDKRKMSGDADVRLHGNNMTAEFWAPEQPSNPEETFTVRVRLVPENFISTSGKPLTREDLMMLLHSLQNITLKASYFEQAQAAHLVEFGLEVSSQGGPHDSVLRASSVEQCLCPGPYTGPSCQQCAPGYYRVEGSFLGACVPCDCNGHSDKCDPDTGVCFECEDNTHGDHCEFCNEGHYGDATTGSPYSCLACACPYTDPSNNFAKSCMVSEYGEVQSCECKPGYAGERCDRCSAGFFGEPNRIGSTCQQCQCNQNNNLTDPRACHPLSGDCYLCEKNTSGRHCEWCAPWYHGDAINAKNCTECSCDKCGAERCNNQDGTCQCKPNVVGENCDRCAADHWGFNRCGGCHACHCGIAASSGQCQGETGQCACRPGAAGLRCEHCEHGYWNYGEHGCQKCDCEADLSMGTVCDVRTGQCHCQEGATGARCDQCEKSYLRIPTLGCRRCDECVFHLIDDTDRLSLELDFLNTSISNISSAAVVGARLSRSNKTLVAISELTNLEQYNNFIGDAKNVLTSKAMLFNNANRSAAVAQLDVYRAKNLTQDASNVLNDIRDRVTHSREVISTLRNLVASLGSHSSALNLDPRWVEDAQMTLMNLESVSASDKSEVLENAPRQLAKVSEKLDEIKQKLDLQKDKFETNKEKREKLSKYLADAQKYIKESKAKAELAVKKARNQSLFKLEGLSKAISDDMEKLADERKAVNDILLEVNNKTESSRDDREKIENELLKSLTELRAEVTEAVEGGKIVEKRSSGVDLTAVKSSSDDLNKQAVGLNNTFGSARAESQNAVEAASAYQSLADILTNAQEKTSETQQVAEAEKNGLGELKEQVGTTLTESKKLSENAATLVSKNLAELTKEAEQVEHQVDRLTNEVDALRTARQELFEGVTKPYNDTVKEEIERRIDSVNDIKAKIDQALEDDRDKIQKTKEDAESAVAAHTEAIQDVKTARSNIRELANIAPALTASYEKMKSLYENTTGRLDAIQEKMSQIREMIAVARNAANRIRLGAHFERGSSLDLHMPVKVSRAAVHTDISFYFRTLRDHGIPLFFGNEEGSAGTRAVPTDDYIAVELEHGTPKITIDLGEKPHVVKLDTRISDNQWRRLNVERIGRSVKVTLSKPNSEEVAETKQVTVEGNKNLLNLHQTMSKLFVGGIPRNIKISQDVRNRDFEGDIEDLQIHGEPVGLWNTREGGMVNVAGAEKRQRNTDLAENPGVSLNGDGYIVLERGHWNPKTQTVFSLQFLTYSPDGLLFFIGKDKHFLALELNFGQLKLSVDFGSGVGQWTTEESDYNDGKWHTVSVMRDGVHVKLEVDGKEAAEGDSPGTMDKLNVTDSIYLGGIPAGIATRTPVESLRGCLKAVRLQSDEVDLMGKTVRASKGVRNACPLGTVSTVSVLSERSSAIFSNVTVGEELEVALRFKTREKSGSLLTIKTEDDDLLVLSINDGILTASAGDDKLTLDLTSASDEQWHFVAVKKTKELLTIDVDDLHSKQSPRSNGEDVSANGQHSGAGETALIVFGRQDSGSFIGCVGDVTVNGKLLDFSKAKTKEISLVGCSLKEDIIKTTVAPTIVVPTEKEVVKEELGEEVAISTAEAESVKSEALALTDATEPEQGTRPEGSCALPRKSRGELPDSEGTRFGAAPNSHLEYDSSPDAFDTSAIFTMQLRPTAHSGVILLATNEKRTDHIALFLSNGKLVFSFDGGNGQELLKSNTNLLDGKWHNVKITRRNAESELIVDEESVERTSEHTDAIDTQAPIFVGGVPLDFAAFVRTLVPGVAAQYSGCLRNLELNGKPFQQPVKEENTVPCKAYHESGMYFGEGGGYAVLKKEYHVGQSFSADMEVRPRTRDAVLFSVGRVEYLTVQIINGTVKYTVDSGGGPEVLHYVPSEDISLCDGHWHTIKILKKKHLMTLTVDGKSNLHIMKKSKKPDTVTNDPIYVGGLPEGVKNNGLETTENYVGCMRISNYGDKKSRMLRRKKKQLDVANMEVFGDVNRLECPAN